MRGNNQGGYWGRDVGYAKIAGNGALRFALFADAPRAYRIEALDKLPDLLEQLIKNTDKTAKKLQEKTAESKELASALR
jgi:hypothetical protein